MSASATAFDAFSGVASAAIYLIVAIAALAYAPRDARARVFLAIALCSILPYVVPALMWSGGAGGVLRAPLTIAAGISIGLGSVALFHFTQVFPSRRPWIRAHRVLIVIAYAVVLGGAAIGTWAFLPFAKVMTEMESSGTGGLGAFEPDPIRSLALLVVLLPTVIVAGIVLPFAGLLSLYRSWQEATRDGGARVTTLAILISQLAGGVLTILVVPLLHLLAPTGPLVTIAAALLFGFGLLFPIAFSIGVWKYRLLA